MISRLFFLFLSFLLASFSAYGSTKGCVRVFADGSEQCSPVLLGTICELAPNSSMTINGRRVVRAYDVPRCDGYDGLGRKTTKEPVRADSGNLTRCSGGSNSACRDPYCWNRCDLNRDGKVEDKYINGVAPYPSEIDFIRTCNDACDQYCPQ